MAQIQPLLDPIGGFVYTATISNATAVNNPLADDKVTIFQLEVDNTANSAVTFLKVYNAASPAHASNAPFQIFKVEASTKQHFIMPAGTEIGYFSFIVTTTQANTGSPTATSSPVDIALLYGSAPV
tara:strand:- start:1695 stop:2072 length:378 start_codon:yes stop_codon:yes gene_type:complete